MAILSGQIKDLCADALLDACLWLCCFEYDIILNVFLSSQFEQENQRLIGEMNSLFDEVRCVCGFSGLMAYVIAFPETGNLTNFGAPASTCGPGHKHPPTP